MIRKKNIPNPTLRRLPAYYNIFTAACAAGKDYISSAEIADYLGVDNTQVRKDMAMIGYVGKPKVGFDTCNFIAHFTEIVKLKRKKKAVLIGAGNLGIAVARYDGFKKYGLEICGVFDNDTYKIGLKVKNKEILSISSLSEFIQATNTQIAILAVPAQHAQDVADSLSKTKIKAIWNFAPVNLRVPDSMIVWNQDLGASFLTLSILIAKGNGK